jgi:ectoine hydroxylase-related dioxygenase (phytanoyl-CoA dioxygenase family)
MPGILAELAIDATLMRDVSNSKWRSEIKDIYDAYGLVLLKKLIWENELRAIQSEIRVVIDLAIGKLREAGKISRSAIFSNKHRFDAGMLDICAADRAVGGEIFRVTKKLLSVQRMPTKEVFENISTALMGKNVALQPSGTNVRADHPGEDHYLYPWHQDYLYNLGSQDSITFWSPLIDVDDVNGCLLVAPCSHKNGALPVWAHDPLNQEKNSSRSLTIADLDEILKKHDLISLPMNAGDVVVFHGNLLHASQPNKSDATRWSLQFRYFNLEAPDAVKFGWPGGMAEGLDIAKFHPELVRHPGRSA